MNKDWIEVSYRDLVDKVSTVKNKLKQKEYSDTGKFPVIDQGKESIGGYTDREELVLKCRLPVIVFGDHTKTVKLIDYRFVPGADGTKVLVPKPVINPNFLAYNTKILTQKIEDKGYARHYQQIENQTIFLPPLPEQRAIVARIEELFSELDHSVSNLQAAQAKLEIYRQAVLKKAFEGGFTNPKSIKWIELGEVCDNVEYGSSSKSEDEGSVPVLRMGNIQNGKFDWSDLKYSNSQDEINKYLLSNGDVLFNRTNSPEHVGKTAIFRGGRKAIFAGYLIRINYKKREVVGDYLCYFLNSHTAKQYGDSVKSFGVNQSNINGTKLKKYPFPITSIKDQDLIVQEIESRLSVADKMAETIQTSLQKAEALRQSILKKAFEGKLLTEAEVEACRKESDWEPAERLLARIDRRRNERIKSEKSKNMR